MEINLEDEKGNRITECLSLKRKKPRKLIRFTIMRMNILLTGYGPFLRNKTNPSGQVSSALNGVVLEVSYAKVASFLEREDSDFLLSLGLHAQATQPRLEVRAQNKVNRVTPDVYGIIPKDYEIEKEEGDLATLVDIPELYAHLIKKGFPCSISDNAGTYLCNYLYFKALKKKKGNALFIHFPPVSEEWPLERMKAFVEEVQTWLRHQ